MATEARTSNYWISTNAIYIQLNAMGEANYIQGNVASGAYILCYMQGIEGLGYDAGHNYQRWQLSLSPTVFPDNRRRYIYVAIPRARQSDNDMAFVCFPPERIDIYGKKISDGSQLGSTDYYYVFLQGIISASETEAGALQLRDWEAQIETGTLASDEAIASGGEGSWWQFNSASDTITFLKTILSATFDTLTAKVAKITNLVLGGSTLTGVATEDTSSESNDKVVTPKFMSLFGEQQWLSKTHDDAAKGEITFEKLQHFLQGMKVGANGEYGQDAFGNLIVNLLQSLDYNNATQSGFGFYKRKDGKYGLNISELMVWGKAIFNTLQIRELDYVGGNMVFSSAASKIFAVKEVVDGNGDVTGWKCYLLADNGSTSTMNMWKKYDQAKCETFNIQSGVYENVSNKYYWRLVTDVSTENEQLTDDNGNVLYDGQKFAWIILSKSDCENDNNDVPQAGDSIVQEGNRNETDRQNIIVLETMGDAAPRFVSYDHVNSYSLTDKEVWIISPKQFIVKAEYIEITTSTGDKVKLVNYRGDWQQGTEYGYYDEVTWMGTRWLCMVADGKTTTSEPSKDNSEWMATTAIMDVTLSFVLTLGDWIDKGETNHLSCSVIRGFEDITSEVTSWSITRDSGDKADDAAWLNKPKVKNFDGEIDICWTDEENDIGQADTCIFTVTAYGGNKTKLATRKIEI